MGVTLALMLAAGLTVRVYAGHRRATHTVLLAPYDRVRTAMAHYPQVLAGAKHRAVAIGASHMEMGFLPATFDRTWQQVTGEPITSVNMGFVAMRGEFQRELVAQLAETSTDVAIFEFSPMFATKKANNLPGLDAFGEGGLAVIGSRRFLLSEMFRDPERAFRMLAHRYFLTGLRPQTLATDLRARLFPQPSWWPVKPPPSRGPPASLAAHGALAVRFWWIWDVAARGGRIDRPDDPAIAQYVRALEDPAWHKFVLGVHEIRSGVRDLDLDPARIDETIGMIRELQRTRPVVVVVTPVEAELLVETPRSIASRAAAVEKIVRETGVCVLDYYVSNQFVASDFRDFDHLNVGGAEKFSRMLAERIGPWVKAGADPKACPTP